MGFVEGLDRGRAVGDGADRLEAFLRREQLGRDVWTSRRFLAGQCDHWCVNDRREDQGQHRELEALAAGPLCRVAETQSPESDCMHGQDADGRHAGKEGVVPVEGADDREAARRPSEASNARIPQQLDQRHRVKRKEPGRDQLDAAGTGLGVQVGG